MCYKNVIIEDRGIIIGIMYYILKYFMQIFDKRIVIEDGRIRKMIKYLFYDLDIHKSGDGIRVNIRNNVMEEVVINNYNNLDTIPANNLYILPWSNRDNPMVMFRVSQKGERKDPEKFKAIVEKHQDKFQGCRTFRYDLVIDNDIIQLYCDMYKIKSHSYVSNLIACYLNNWINCRKQTILQPVYLPMWHTVREYVPYPVVLPVEKTVEKPKDCPPGMNDKHVGDLIRGMADKTRVLNEVLSDKAEKKIIEL